MRDDLHQTRRRRSSVRYRTSRGQHGHVKAERDVLFSGVVHASYMIGLGFVSHQFWMFLYDQYKTSLTLLCVRKFNINIGLSLYRFSSFHHRRQNHTECFDTTTHPRKKKIQTITYRC